MDTIRDQSPERPPVLTAGQVRAECAAFTAALDVAQSMLDTYREMVERFKASGTLEVDAGSRAKLIVLESDDAAFAAMDRLDAIARGDDPR